MDSSIRFTHFTKPWITRFWHCWWIIIITPNDITYITLEECIDDERQFKTVKCSQAPGDATVLKRFFHDNFVIFRHRSKTITFLESMNFSYDMQIFYFRDGHVTTFRHPSGAYICQIPGQTLQTSKRHTFRVSTFHRYYWFGGKLFPVGCAQAVEGYLKNVKMLFFGSGSAHVTKFWNFSR